MTTLKTLKNRLIFFSLAAMAVIAFYAGSSYAATVSFTSATNTTATVTLDLSATDFYVFGDNVRKSVGPSAFSDVSSDAPVTWAPDSPVAVSWIGGDPTASSAGSTNYDYGQFGDSYSPRATYAQFTVIMPYASGKLDVWLRPNGNGSSVSYTVTVGGTAKAFTDTSGNGDLQRLRYTISGAAVSEVITVTVDSVSGSNGFHNVGFMAAQLTTQASLSFDGSNDYVYCGNSAFQIETGTWEAWFKANTLGIQQTIMAKDNTGYNDDGWLGIASDNRIYFYIDRDSNDTCYELYSDSTVSTGVWYHVAVTWGSGGMKMYVNGTLQADTDTNTSGIVNSVRNLEIGDRNPSPCFYFNGQIDEVRIWNIARTGADIYRDMGVTLTGSESNLLAYYRFDEGTGTTATDLAGGDQNGTLASSPTWMSGDVRSGKL